MSAAFDNPSLYRRALPLLQGFDGLLAFAVFLLACAGLLIMYSSGFEHGTRFADHGRNMLIAGAIMFVVAQVPPQRLMLFAVPLYGVGVALLVAVLVFGITKKGARRWLNIGVVIQPSEILKIAMPLMLAWWFQKREGQVRPLDFVAAMMLLAVPVALIMKQPDLGTSLLVMAAGLAVIFFAGLSWKLIAPPVLATLGRADPKPPTDFASACRFRPVSELSGSFMEPSGFGATLSKSVGIWLTELAGDDGLVAATGAGAGGVGTFAEAAGTALLCAGAGVCTCWIDASFRAAAASPKLFC